MILFLTLIISSSCQAKQSYKLYKDSALSTNEWYLILDMKHFGKSIQEEECNRLKEYYSSINTQRKFRCIKSDNTNDPIKL